jgi:anion-transporting  ArsA/GET3 family ATPase
MPQALRNSRLVVVAGKGGTGRTTVAAALALALAAAGRRPLAVETGPTDSLARALGLAEAGYEPRPAAGGTLTARLTARECLLEYGLMKLKLRPLFRRIFEAPFVRELVNMLPGMEEMLLIGKIGYMVRQAERLGAKSPIDVVVLDAPPTGQGAGLLTLPSTVLAAAPVGPVAREMAALRNLLVDAGRTSIVLVTLPEELPVDETLQLASELTGRGLPVAAIVVNRRIDWGPGATERQVLGSFLQSDPAERSDPIRNMVAAALDVQAMAETQEKEIARLRTKARSPIIELPWQTSGPLSAEGLGRLAGRLRSLLVEGAG